MASTPDPNHFTELKDKIKTLEEENIFLKLLLTESEEEHQEEISRLKQEITTLKNKTESGNTRKNSNIEHETTYDPKTE